MQAVTMSIVYIYIEHFPKGWRDACKSFSDKLKDTINGMYIKGVDGSRQFESLVPAQARQTVCADAFRTLHRGTDIDFELSVNDFWYSGYVKNADEHMFQKQIDETVKKAIDEIPVPYSEVIGTTLHIGTIPKKEYDALNKAKGKGEPLSIANLQERIAVLEKENAKLKSKPALQADSVNDNENLKDIKQQLTDAQKTIDEQIKTIQEQGAEIDRLNTLNEVIDKQLKRFQDEETTIENLDKNKKLEIDERIIFVSALLGVSLKPDVVNQTQLAKLIEKLTGDTCQSVRPRISSINSETQQVIDKTRKQFSEGTQSAAKNVYELINKAVKGATRENKGYQCKQAMENINQTYQLGIKM